MTARRHRILRLVSLAVAAAALASSAADSVIRAAAPGSQQNRLDVLILFASHPDAAEQDNLRRLGGNIKHAYRIVPALAANLPEAAVEALRQNPRVIAVDPDVEITAADLELDNTWGVGHIGSGSVHDTGNKGAGVRVAVLDSGIDYGHPELAGSYAGGYDFVNGDPDPSDDNGHGTHVAGTIAAADNDDGSSVVGVAPEANLIALKVLGASGSGSFGDVVAALDWLVEYKELNPGEYVANHSYTAGIDPGLTVVMAFHNAYAEGILHVAAAGNTGNCAGKGGGIGFPALYESVISVAAVDETNTRACFSSVGPDAELSAPGVGILSTALGGGYALSSGTSMASPHVAGVAALVMSGGIADVNANGRINDDVRTALITTAEDLGAAGRDTWYGYGLVDAVAADASNSPPTPPGTIAVQSITYRINNNRGAKTLVVTVTVVDGTGAPVRLAEVTATIRRNGVAAGGDTQLSATNGQAIFWINEPTAGVYTTTVDDVVFPGLTWNGITPANQYVKN
jgi:subtilisin family serine protease